ncbi:YjcZ family sporulation protein [Paenibacillus motobuensis]|nr:MULTISPECIES: YjcZ family sporulation protein [Paenibacillus]MCM3038736.1 YjcZ family sporulation protein [Paenibacillus lutimineralis]MCM3645840.1 YjcZ family sporulation protein [Paenibacillus motobuensis]
MGELGGIGSCSCSCGGLFTNTAAILVLFILLVIVSRAFFF